MHSSSFGASLLHGCHYLLTIHHLHSPPSPSLSHSNKPTHTSLSNSHPFPPPFPEKSPTTTLLHPTTKMTKIKPSIITFICLLIYGLIIVILNSQMRSTPRFSRLKIILVCSILLFVDYLKLGSTNFAHKVLKALSCPDVVSKVWKRN